MVARIAIGVLSASTVYAAGVLATSVDARLVERTIRVRPTGVDATAVLADLSDAAIAVRRASSDFDCNRSQET